MGSEKRVRFRLKGSVWEPDDFGGKKKKKEQVVEHVENAVKEREDYSDLWKMNETERRVDLNEDGDDLCLCWLWCWSPWWCVHVILRQREKEKKMMMMTV